MRHRRGWITAFLSAACLWSAALEAAPCAPSATALCLSAGRFEVTVAWKDFQGNTGSGQAVPLTADTGTFWFFTPSNVELVVKVLDARALNGHFWVFYGALSNVEYELTVWDLETGDVRVYENPSGQFASTGDTLAFPPDSVSLALPTPTRALGPVGSPVHESAVLPAVWDSAAACTPTSTSLCLNGGRFRLEAAWKDFQGNTGIGQAVGLTGDTGYFWFFNSANVEAVVKVLDARPLNDHFWVFYGALSNVEYTLTVTDTVTGIVKTYRNPSSLFASVGDTLAFGKPTTFQLIDGAVVKGEINADTALLYKVYAFFGDARLPQAYRGDPAGRRLHGILLEVADRWPGLSAQTQQALQPFLIPPIYPESWFAQASASRSPGRDLSQSIVSPWIKIPTIRALVWYRAADAGAETAAHNLSAEIENVWDKEVGLMGRSPLSDGGETNNGGDNRLDIYVLPFIGDAPDDLGQTCSYRAGGPQAAYILIKVSAASTVAGARDVLAHEFFHAIAATYPFKDGSRAYRWMNEATAQWMEDYVYPTQINNLEQGSAPDYFNSGYKDWFDVPDDGGYQDYVFFFYLAWKFGPGYNRDIWDNVVSMSSLDAINTAIPGGFKQRWPEFALYCWNEPDVNWFNVWDKLWMGLNGDSAEPHLKLEHGDPTGTILPQRSAPNLAMSYAFVEVSSDSIKRVEIQNQPVAAATDYARTQAWIKLADGTTRVEDWTERPRVVFCRDKAEQNVTELLILYTNSGPALNSPDIVWNEGKVIADSAGCGGYRGTGRATTRFKTQDATINETVEATATFLALSAPASSTEHYYLAQLTLRYSYFEKVGCTWTIGPATQTFTFGPSDGEGSEIVLDRTTQPPGYSALAGGGFEQEGTQRCPGGIVNHYPAAAGGSFLNVPAGRFRVNQDGSLSGSYTETIPRQGVTATRTWTWDFKPD